jgi:ComF family protein
LIFQHSLACLSRALSSLFFPPVCVFCTAALEDTDTSLCESCTESLRIIPDTVCGQCGMPVPGLLSKTEGVCGRCLAHPPRYERARYAVEYTGPLRDTLIRFKFSGVLHAGKGLGEVLLSAFCRYFAPGEFDVILPVPLHRNRLAVRGFNQVVVLGEQLSSTTGIPLDRTSFRKIKDTPPQVGLSRSERINNLRGSFGISRPERIRGKSVLLIDDVATTGSTIAEAAKIIARAKASRVTVLVLALRPDVSRAEKVPNETSSPNIGVH